MEGMDADNGIRQDEAWPGFDAGLPAPPGFPLPRPQERVSTPPPRRRLLAGLIAAALVLSGVIGVAGGALWRDGGQTSPATQGRPISGSTGSVGSDASAVAAAVAPAIVNINTFRTTFDATSSSLAPLGAGTGMILTSTGEVLTNNHVVQGASRIDVEVAGHTDPFAADVLGVNPTGDVALLQLRNASNLPTVSLGTASSLSTGQSVIAIGNALGRGGAPSVTTGTISGLHRSITARNPNGSSERLDDLIQMTASIQPGDSGGALTDLNGNVIGMITAGAAGSDATRPAVVGFAIPLDAALNVVTEIRAGRGSSTILLGERGYLGVAVDPNFDFSTAPALGIDASNGAMVTGVQPGSPAEGAGMTAPAVITTVDGQSVGSTEDLGPLLHVHTPGERVQVTWVDGSGTHTATVALAPGPAV